MAQFSDELPPFIEIIYDVQIDHYIIGARGVELDSWRILHEEDLKELYKLWKKIVSLRPPRRQIS